MVSEGGVGLLRMDAATGVRVLAEVEEGSLEVVSFLGCGPELLGMTSMVGISQQPRDALEP